MGYGPRTYVKPKKKKSKMRKQFSKRKLLSKKKKSQCLMPVRKVKGGWQWSKNGKIFKTKKAALRQARAAYASGYKMKERT